MPQTWEELKLTLHKEVENGVLTTKKKWKKHQIGAIVISPTRELAIQTKSVLEHFLKFVKNLTQILLVGGNSVEEDIRSFKDNGGNIIICTPGRFEDLLTRRKELNLPNCVKNLEILILDEADRLLDLGFQKSIDTILSYLPRQRRTGLFSATQTKEVEDLIRAGLRNPVLVSVSAKATQSTPDLLNNYYIVPKNNGKLATLITFLESKSIQKAMLFLPTCASVDYWSHILPSVIPKKLNLPVLAIHGKMKEKRKKILESFQIYQKLTGYCNGILLLVLAPSFIGLVELLRQGQQGSALILLLENEEAYVNFIEANQKVKLTQISDLTSAVQIKELLEKVRNLLKKDRALMDKATQAFVSHIRAYSKHECSLLLRVKVTLLSMHYFDVNSVPYKDKVRESIRKQKLEEYKKTGKCIWPGHKQKFVKKPSEPWSITKQKKEDRKGKRQKRKQSKEAKLEKNEPFKKKKRKGISEEDLEELKKRRCPTEKIEEKEDIR
ncbi:hypothetical protein NQ317_001138 [Molorchus minor]|uniref:ATP-dependent RNA helicase n=1 Tax=Molorchus minor TaxID=1323400 RepID=A0ABQ9J7M9_9CUCU|nr:hypothetical protein NQ317_001138 [Molorchus minor]